MILKQKLSDFIEKYDGKTKGYPTDKYYKGQCLSICKIYIKECFGINPPPSGTGSAYGYWSKFPSPLGTVFEKVKNTSKATITEGCIPVWNTNVGGGYGHIEVCIEKGTLNTFRSFGQNWGGKHSHITRHNYKNIVGWLKPKITNSEPIMNKDEKKALEVLRKFKKEKKELKDGNLEGAINAMVGWANKFKEKEKELKEFKENLKNSLKINTELKKENNTIDKVNKQAITQLIVASNMFDVERKTKKGYKVRLKKLVKRDVCKLKSWELLLVLLKRFKLAL